MTEATLNVVGQLYEGLPAVGYWLIEFRAKVNATTACSLGMILVVGKRNELPHRCSSNEDAGF